MQVPVFLFLFLAPVYVPRAAARRLGPRRRPVQPGDARDGDRPRSDRRPGRDYLATLGIVVALLALVTLFMFRGLRQAEAAG